MKQYYGFKDSKTKITRERESENESENNLESKIFLKNEDKTKQNFHAFKTKINKQKKL